MTTIQFLAEWAIRSSILILSGALLLQVLRVKDPAVRLATWTAILLGSVAIPALTASLPKLSLVTMPSLTRAVEAPVVAIPEAPVAFHPDRDGAPVSTRFEWPGVALMIYVLVALALLLRLGVGLAMSLRLLRSSRATNRKTEGIEIRESDLVATPVTLGIVRPSVVLPVDWRQWDGPKLDAVLAHERSHIRRHDPAIQLLSAVHRALLWYSPLSWFLHRRIVRVAEDLSDDAAVAVTRDRPLYAEVLLGFIQRGVKTADSGVPMARYGRADKRIDRILNGTTLSRGVTRWSVAAILALGSPLAYVVATAQAQIMPFEVASIRVNKSGARQASFEMSPGGERLVARNLPLAGLIVRAYDVGDNQVSGNSLAMSLLRETSLRYDLDAKAEHPVSRSDMMRMLQTLLADRFQLSLHRETREVSGYVLAIAEGGSKLSEHTGPPVTDCAGGRRNDGEFTFQSCPISFFASQILTGITGGAYVVDRTGLQGSYDFHLMASWELPPPNPAEYPDAGDSPRIMNPGAPSIFIALPKQLGLKLEKQRVAVQFIYIDHAGKPSGN